MKLAERVEYFSGYMAADKTWVIINNIKREIKSAGF
jgi:hypothetical protein